MSSKRKVFYIIGVGGIPNYGDEFILLSWIKWIRDKHPGCDIWIDTPNPAKFSEMLGFLGIDGYCTDFLWSFNKEASLPHISKSKFINRLLGFINTKILEKNSKMFSKKYTKRLFDNVEKLVGENIFYDRLFMKNVLREVDSIHVVGGGYINALWLNNLGIIKLCSELKVKYGFKLFFTGAGFMPLFSRKSLIKNELTHADYVETRDRESAEGYNLNLGLDDAFLGINNLIKLVDSNYLKGDYPDVLVCIQHDLVKENIYKRLLQILAARVSEYVANGKTVGYVEAFPQSDRDAYIYLRDLIPEKFYFNLDYIMKYGLPVKRNQVWYTSRFHHHLLASALGVGGVILSFKPGYYDIKHNSLLELGTGWAYFSAYDDVKLPYPSIASEYEIKVKNYVDLKTKVAEKLYS